MRQNHGPTVVAGRGEEGEGRGGGGAGEMEGDRRHEVSYSLL